MVLSPTRAGQTKGLLMTDSVDTRLYTAMLPSSTLFAVMRCYQQNGPKGLTLGAPCKLQPARAARRCLEHYNSTSHTSSGNPKNNYFSKLRTQPSTSQSHASTTALALPRLVPSIGCRPGVGRGILASSVTIPPRLALPTCC